MTYAPARLTIGTSDLRTSDGATFSKNQERYSRRGGGLSTFPQRVARGTNHRLHHRRPAPLVGRMQCPRCAQRYRSDPGRMEPAPPTMPSPTAAPKAAAWPTRCTLST